MGEEQHLAKLANSIVTFDVHDVKQIVQEALHAGISPYKILTEGLAKGIKIVGQRYENGEYFLPELVMAGETMKRAIYVLKPFLKSDKSGAKGRVVIGTVEGDIHDIGKNLVITFLTAAGLEVYDLGVDVPAEKFVEKVKETQASVLCLSALLTTTIPEMKNVIDTLKRAGIRERVKVVIGGAPLNEEIVKKVGADLYGGDAADGAALIIDRYFSDQTPSQDA
jgi:corrinoid protein of di/trimethylamine methyltransferase